LPLLLSHYSIAFVWNSTDLGADGKKIFAVEAWRSFFSSDGVVEEGLLASCRCEAELLGRYENKSH
jgi:hypothetical protein